MAYKGQKKRIDPNETHGFIGDAKAKYKPPKKEPYDAAYERGYWLLRDRCLYKICDEETKKAILERYAK